MIEELLETLLSGIINGSVYSLIAIGLSLVYGITNTFNFAYGSLFVLAGYTAWLLFSFGLSYPFVFLSVLIILFILSMLIDYALIGPLRKKRKDWEIAAILTTLGLALFLDNLHLALYGPWVKSLPPLVKGSINIAENYIPKHDVIAFFASFIVIGLYYIFLKKTWIGMAMRAVAQDIIGADIVAIPRNRIFITSFGISGVLVAFAAILSAPRYFVVYTGGWEILIKGWVMTAFGGLGSILGAIVAAFILAIVEAFVGWKFGFTWTLAAWFIVLIGVFIFRPKGLFGTRS